MRQSFDNCGIDPRRIDRRAKSVLSHLRSAGFEAWLVGGAVRDLLLDRRPKDFDVATDALPEEICSVFHRARIVGRRFRIVHVHHGRNVTEVSTYRTSNNINDTKVASSLEDIRGQARVVSSDGMILRDNAWGSQQEDALRRDFTINAFYYDPLNDELVDYCGGFEDLKRRSLRLIGDPNQRLIEDPVRILRAVRIAAKLKLSIEAQTMRAMRQDGHLMEKVTPRRKYDECVKLFMNGHGEASWRLVQDFNLERQLFPARSGLDTLLIERALCNTDLRIREDRPVTFAFLLSVIYFRAYEHAREILKDDFEGEELHTSASGAALDDLKNALAIPRHVSHFMRDVWALQSRLESFTRPTKTLASERFRAGYDLLSLRADTGGAREDTRDWWKSYQEDHPSSTSQGDSSQRSKVGAPGRRRPRRRRNRQQARMS